MRNRNQSTNVTKPSKPRRNNGKDKDTLKSTTNDPSWYSVDPVILRDAASFPFAHPAGHPLYLGREDRNTGAYIPGVIAMDILPTIGDAVDASAPVNIAATQTYAFIRHGNSGSVNYDAGDIMLYFLAMADAYSYVEYLKRVYGIAQLYAQRNRFMPYTLIQAMKVDPTSLEYNLANFRLGINMLINKLASFSVPNTMSVFHRRAFLYQNVYTEGDSVKDQLYLFTPYAFGIYDWINSKVTNIRFTPEAVTTFIDSNNVSTNQFFTVQQLLEFGNRMIDLIISNEDLGTMNGDILKVYGDNIIKLAHISEDFVCVPIKDIMVLEQFHNANVLGEGTADLSSFDVVSTYTESEGFEGVSILKSSPCIKFGVGASSVAKNVVLDETANESVSAVLTVANAEKVLHIMRVASICNNRIIDTSSDQVTPEQVMELTRLVPTFARSYSQTLQVPVGSVAPANSNDIYYLSTGTEVPMSLRVFVTPGSMTEPGEEVIVEQITGSEEYLALVARAAAKTSPLITPASLGLTIPVYTEALWAYKAALKAFKYAPIVHNYDISAMVNASFCAKIADLKMPAANGIEGSVCNYTVITPEQLAKLNAVAMLNEFATPHVAILK